MALGLGLTAAMPAAFKAASFGMKAVRPALSLATSGPLGRAVVGAGIGAGVGYFGNDYQSGQNIFESVMKGAALGAVGGVAIGAVPRMAGAIGRGALSAGPGFIGAAGRVAGKTARFAFEHPVLTAGALGGAALISGMPTGGTSPTMSGARVNQQYDRQQAAMMEMTGGMGMLAGSPVGPAPQMMSQFHRAHQASTTGLVQGLHRGRHG